jgi:phosphodiesterase/alkaline phosphatase D-like protein
VNYRNITFAAYGDMGDSTSAHQVMFLLRELITFKNVDLVLHAGDITYANGYQVRSLSLTK